MVWARFWQSSSNKVYLRANNLRICGRSTVRVADATTARCFSDSIVPGNHPITTTPKTRLPKKLRRLDVAIVGRPNSGKSQLLNELIQEPVAAVSRKRHTTRQGILGARTVSMKEGQELVQLLFVDTPGFLRTQDAKEEWTAMVGSSREISQVDYSLIVVDAAAKFTEERKATVAELILQALKARGRIEEYEPDINNTSDEDCEVSDGNDIDNDNAEPRMDAHAEIDDQLANQKFAVVLNKVDLVHPKSDLVDLAMEIGQIAIECLQYRGQTDPTKESSVPLEPEVLERVMPTFFYTSALKNEGVDDLLNFLLEKATPSEVFEVEPGMSTLLEPEERAEEIIREKLYRCLHKEIPYNILQSSRLFQVSKSELNGELCVRIEQDLIVKTKSHQAIVNGRGYQTLSRIRESAQRDLQKLFGCKVKLSLYVKLLKSKNRNWSV